MIRNNINELFVKLEAYSNGRIKNIEFEKIIEEAINYLNELRQNYYLIPKINIDNNISFETGNNENAEFVNYYARFRINSVTTIKKSIMKFILLEPIKNNLKMNIIRNLEKEEK